MVRKRSAADSFSVLFLVNILSSLHFLADSEGTLVLVVAYVVVAVGYDNLAPMTQTVRTDRTASYVHFAIPFFDTIGHDRT